MAASNLGGTVLSYLASAVGGILVWMLIQKPLEKFVDSKFSQRKASLRLRSLKELKSILAIEDKTVQIGDEQVHILEFEPHGFRRENIVTSRRFTQSTIEETISNIRADLLPLERDLIVQRIRKRISDLDSSLQKEWNGEKLALESILLTRSKNAEESVVQLSFNESNYATFDVISKLWKEFYSKNSNCLSISDLRQVQPGLSHSFGLNATLRTADDKLLLTKRDPRANSGRDRRHIAINEGLDLRDSHVDGTPDLYRGIVRGAYEELGVLCTPKDVTFHSFVLDVSRYQWGALGHVDLRGSETTADFIRHQRTFGRARDDWETSALEFIECSPEAVIRSLAENAMWVAHGWVNLFLTGLFLWPSDAENFSRQVMQQLSPPRS